MEVLKEMRKMFTLSATAVRRDWSSIVDSVVREKPKFIKRTRDLLVLSNLDVFESLLAPYTFHADKFIESDGSITLSLNEIDLIETAKTEKQAKLLLAKSILDYAEDYYNDFTYWSSASNRKSHIPYILKALILDNVNRIGELIQCQVGEN
jgi:antitoxin YefM